MDTLTPGREAVGAGRVDQDSHIERYADSMFRAKRGAFINGDAVIRPRNVDRSFRSRSTSAARLAATRTNQSSRSSANSVRPRLESWLHPPRLTAATPVLVTTGTPIQNESRLVVWPL